MAIPSLIDANAYHTDRANDAWTNLSDSDKTASLYRALDYILYSYTFKSTILDPSTDANVQEAVIMLAGTMAEAVEGSQSILADMNISTVKEDAAIKREKKQLEGVGMTETEYQASAIGTDDPFPLVTARLKSVTVQKASVTSVKVEN